MPEMKLTLPEGDTGAWHVVFDPDEVHLYVGFAAPGREIASHDKMTVEDFLVWLARDELHRRAHKRFVALHGNGDVEKSV